uniref:Uncharacterized protein n=1 Tax=Micrurus lemniscatus lemniscatus TaxID=129467 RepID=A0A2D4HJL6_MICLE
MEKTTELGPKRLEATDPGCPPKYFSKRAGLLSNRVRSLFEKAPLVQGRKTSIGHSRMEGLQGQLLKLDLTVGDGSVERWLRGTTWGKVILLSQRGRSCFIQKSHFIHHCSPGLDRSS